GWIFGLHDQKPSIVREIHFFPECFGDLTDSSPFLPVATERWNYLQGGFPEAITVCKEGEPAVGQEMELLDPDDEEPPLIRADSKDGDDQAPTEDEPVKWPAPSSKDTTSEWLSHLPTRRRVCFFITGFRSLFL